MTSFKKPLIAIVSAMVLTATALVASPANAVGATYTLTGGDSVTKTGATEALAISLPVPADNSVDSADVLDFALTGITAGETVAVVATDATLVTAVSTVSAPVTASSGVSRLDITTGTGTTAGFKVYTKTTKVGKVVVTVGSAAAVTYYVKGTAGSLNAIALSAPTAALGTTAKVTATGTDVFGNAVSGATVSLQVISATATNTYSLTTLTDGTAVKELTGLSVDAYDLLATATVATAVTGLAKPVGFVKGQLKVVDLAALVAEKDAEIAILKAKLALAEASASGNKAKYNALAKKWNVKFPKAKVKLVK